MCNHIIRLICKAADLVGLDQKVCYQVHDIFMDLVVKKMKSSNNYYSKLETMLEKVRVFGYPEGFDH